MSEELDPLEDLKERYNELKEQARQVDAELTLRKENLGKLEKEAKSNYGTSDLKKLNAKLKEMEKENEAQLKKYQKSLEKIEVELEQIRENSEEMSEDE
jgi:uncharacterized phage infection (PIP) family protein YhgE